MNQFSVEIVSLGDSTDESGAIAFSVGLAPLTERKESWAYPNGSLLLHSNGRGVHYVGQSLMQWRSIRIDRSLNPGDKITLSVSNRKAMFELNGVPMDQGFEEIEPDMYPVVHIQKKGVRIKAHFGKRTNSANLNGPRETETCSQAPTYTIKPFCFD